MENCESSLLVNIILNRIIYFRNKHVLFIYFN